MRRSRISRCPVHRVRRPFRLHSLHRCPAQQLAGYPLLDYSDTYRINRVGLCLSRHDTLITRPVPEFRNALGARTPLSQLRDHLRQAKYSTREGR
ncbi:hypothetical protein ACFTY8_40180 [Streptomyces mirabilis]|uniref:hypothetical protein n=1 Tax=Streptomyces mirabilis TaxID=68239 RepID=UPI00363F3118